MFRYLFVAALLASPPSAQAQDAGHRQVPGQQHDVHRDSAATGRPVQPGQAAFGAIQEIVSMLEADPDTDWSAVDIEALRQHLIDMDNVTLRAAVAAAAVDKGMRYAVTGPAPVRESIARMAKAHAETMNGVDAMSIVVEPHTDGAVMIVTAEDPSDLAKIRGLGFAGVMALGMHHQEHHLMIATGRAGHK